MEWGLEEGQHSVQMLEKPKAFPSFLGRRSFVPRPISGATDFYDLDNASDPDDSPRSLDSRSTASTQEELITPHTPHTGGLGGFEFHFDDKPVEGPIGPHLFRASPDSFCHRTKEAEIEDEADIQKRKSFTAELLVNKSGQLPRTPGSRLFTTLNQAVAELDETQVRCWTPRQVAGWMAEAGFDASVVDKFLIHDISGSVLLDLQFEDLKELDISSFGKRHRVMSSIHHLRNSSLISIDTPLSRTNSKSPRDRAPRTLQRSVRPEECHIVAESRSRSRRRRKGIGLDDVTPAESISIVAIEQLLPKPHKCSKGVDCAKWQKQQRKLARIQQEFAVEAQKALAEENEQTDNDAQRPKSENVPSIIGSSEVLGPAPSFKITAERLNEVQFRDPQENVKHFLSYQHVNGCNANIHNPSPPPAASASFVPATIANAQASTPVPTDSHHAELRGQLPKLFIPVTKPDTDSPSRTPSPEFDDPSTPHRTARAQLLRDPYHYGGVASPADIYRIGTPFSAADVPVTAHAIDPCERVFSNSVPPDMRYGSLPVTANGDPIRRVGSTPPGPRRRLTKQSFAPSVTPVKEDFPLSPFRPENQSHQSSDILAHSGWMRKRHTTKLLRHEWRDNYFSLNGTRLLVLEDDIPDGRPPVDYIDVDEYAVHAYSLATASKLSAAFKKSILGAGYIPSSQQSFAFSLVPDIGKGHGRKVFEKGPKSHHFAVKAGSEKVEWMRRLMLAKAAARNANGNHEI